MGQGEKKVVIFLSVSVVCVSVFTLCVCMCVCMYVCVYIVCVCVCVCVHSQFSGVFVKFHQQQRSAFRPVKFRAGSGLLADFSSTKTQTGPLLLSL